MTADAETAYPDAFRIGLGGVLMAMLAYSIEEDPTFLFLAFVWTVASILLFPLILVWIRR